MVIVFCVLFSRKEMWCGVGGSGGEVSSRKTRGVYSSTASLASPSPAGFNWSRKSIF